MNERPKIISRIKGGLGNQLFCYAAARRLAIANGAELVLDDVTGFIRDFRYQRRYMLDNFNISARRATPAERLEPLGRYRRGLLRWASRRRPFHQRRYIEQEDLSFDPRLLQLEVHRSLYLDGYWQSEAYFKDIEGLLRQELQIVEPRDEVNLRMADQVRGKVAVALHVRWFSTGTGAEDLNVPAQYYARAMQRIEGMVERPHFFVFSDDPAEVAEKLHLSSDRATLVANNRGDANAHVDLWLMSQCQHFITANSTFSWWGAWLGSAPDKVIITPKLKNDDPSSWGSQGQIPTEWIQL